MSKNTKSVFPEGCPIGKRFTKETYYNQQAFKQILATQALLFRDYPFWGVLAVNLIPVEDRSGFVKRLATDGMHIFYNADFVNRLTLRELVFGWAHEIFHCLERHVRTPYGSRMGERDHDLWNQATDYRVNADLKESRVGDVIRPEIVKILYDQKYAQWTAEQIYDDLEKNGSPAAGVGEVFDIHIDVDDACQPETMVSKQEFEQIGEKWETALIQAHAAFEQFQDIAKNGGHIPRGVKRIIDRLIQPKIDWKRALRRFVSTITRMGYSYVKPNRTFFNQGITIPGFRKHDNVLDMVVMVDCSGSIDEEQLVVFASELHGILKAFPAYRVKAWCFESEVVAESVIELTRTGTNTLADLKSFLKRVAGGGGTSFDSNWTYMKEKRIRPKVAVMFTDGYTGDGWGDPTYCPTLFLLNKGHPEAKAPHGVTVHYEAAK